MWALPHCHRYRNQSRKQCVMCINKWYCLKSRSHEWIKWNQNQKLKVTGRVTPKNIITNTHDDVTRRRLHHNFEVAGVECVFHNVQMVFEVRAHCLSVAGPTHSIPLGRIKMRSCSPRCTSFKYFDPVFVRPQFWLQHSASNRFCLHYHSPAWHVRRE